MGQSLVKNYVHLVFSTKYPQPLIHDPIASELFMYIADICNELNCVVLRVGSYVDHIHILCMLSKNITLAKLLEEVKGHSSKWIKTKGKHLANFYWQNGYGAFSVNPADVELMIKYIDNQKIHHEKKSFKVEYESILKENQMEYDERYVWD